MAAPWRGCGECRVGEVESNSLGRRACSQSGERFGEGEVIVTVWSAGGHERGPWAAGVGVPASGPWNLLGLNGKARSHSRQLVGPRCGKPRGAWANGNPRFGLTADRVVRA